MSYKTGQKECFTQKVNLCLQGWNFIFRREPNGWEVMRLAEFLNMVGHFTGLQAYEDMLWWKGNNRGEFKVHSAYRLMDQSSQ
ncbi:hypothetical protein H5410_048406 [Solanum commersonii]|uniref:Uncharacterized protein n=1 Tax=Solanum commersonii TaxID=4109 RepID=A0A9J5XL02_SOLCO|nr:hypothetical protein H5410_048406 [Solanum commersonii]